MTDPLEARFWSKVDRGHPDGCWEWTGATNQDGYGVVHTLGRAVLAHRMSYELTTGLIDDDMVLHSCDNPPCVNPDHLRTGDHADNMADRAERTTHPYLGNSSRDDFIDALGEPVTARELFDDFDVSRRTVYDRLEALEAEGLVEEVGTGPHGATQWQATANDDASMDLNMKLWVP